MKNIIIILLIILLTGCSSSIGRWVQSKMITKNYQKSNPNAPSTRDEYRFEKGHGGCARLKDFCKGKRGSFTVNPKPEYWCECLY